MHPGALMLNTVKRDLNVNAIEVRIMMEVLHKYLSVCICNGMGISIVLLLYSHDKITFFYGTKLNIILSILCKEIIPYPPKCILCITNIEKLGFE